MPTVNKFTITIMIIIMINLKKFRGKTILQDFNEQFSKIIVFLWKKVVLYTATLMHCKARKFYTIYLVVSKEMAQIWHLWQELLKSTSKIWKPRYDWMTWCRQQSEGINFVMMEDLNLWQILTDSNSDSASQCCYQWQLHH